MQKTPNPKNSHPSHKSFYEMMELVEQSRLSKIGGGLLGSALAASSVFGSNANAQSTQPTTKPAIATTQSSNSDADYIGKYISDNEGRRASVYNDGAGNLTIGIGHLLTPQSDSLFQSLFGPIDMDKLRAGQISLTQNQIDRLFEYDYNQHAVKAKKLFPKFDSYPISVKAAIIDGVYRGDLSGSPKTMSLINQGLWAKAAQEYLNNREYKNSRVKGMSGVANRMERNAEAFKNYAKQMESEKN